MSKEDSNFTLRALMINYLFLTATFRFHFYIA